MTTQPEQISENNLVANWKDWATKRGSFIQHVLPMQRMSEIKLRTITFYKKQCS